MEDVWSQAYTVITGYLDLASSGSLSTTPVNLRRSALHRALLVLHQSTLLYGIYILRYEPQPYTQLTVLIASATY